MNLLTKYHFAAETRANAGFGVYVAPLQGAQVRRLLTNPHHALKPAPVLRFTRRALAHDTTVDRL